MDRIVELLHGYGGVAERRELVKHGITGFALTAAVRRGAIFRARRGWYFCADAEPAVVQAVRVGGRLCCLSACRSHGLWTPKDGLLHVAVKPNAKSLRSPHNSGARLQPLSGARVHWDEALRLDAATRLRVSVADALYQAAECASMEDFIVCADSALHQKKIDNRTLTGLLCQLPASFGDARMLWDARAESGIETMARLRLRAAGIPVRVQVAIPTLGRVDLLIGRRLVVELDGREFHTGEERFETDRRRDINLAIRGYSVLRFSYQQVLNEWPSCLAAIRAHMERRVHL